MQEKLYYKVEYWFVQGLLQSYVICYFSWRLESFFLCFLIIGFTGSPTTLMIQAAAYISDVTPTEKRGKRLETQQRRLHMHGVQLCNFLIKQL